MPVFISLLRGINVSGQKKVPMVALRALYETLGMHGVKSYIQSGNVIFATPEADEDALTANLENAVAREFGFPVSVIIRSFDAWQRIARRHPLSAGADPAHLHVTCLARQPGPEALRALETLKTGADRYKAQGREIYLHCPGGYARTKLTNTALEKRLGVTATTRNWKTVGMLLALAKATTP